MKHLLQIVLCKHLIKLIFKFMSLIISYSLKTVVINHISIHLYFTTSSLMLKGENKLYNLILLNVNGNTNILFMLISLKEIILFYCIKANINTVFLISSS